ncbi:MAG: hypothetical protein GY906_38590 [bacterium]|nr:hypothetical protein [bacterium]
MAATQEKVDKAIERMNLNHEVLGIGFARNIVELETNRMRQDLGAQFPIGAEQLAIRIEGALSVVQEAKRRRAEAITIEGLTDEPS